MIRRISLTTLCALGALPLAVMANESTVNRTVNADAKGEVLISNVSGRVEVRAWDRKEVQVTGSLGEDVERVDVESNPGRVVVKVILPHNSNDGDAELVVSVPRESSVEVSAVSADVSSRGVLGSQRLKTVSGEINAEFSGDESEFRSVSGDMVLKGNGKPVSLRASSVSGSVDLTGGAGRLDVVTVSGDARVHMGDTSEISARTTSGELEVNARLLKDARVSAEGVSGDITLNLSGAGLAAEIESFSGDIHGCIAEDVERVNKYGPGVRLNKRTGDGSARVRAKSLSGDIEICDR